MQDPFETPADERQFHGLPVYETCAACHTGSGIQSVNSYTGRFSSREERPLDLALWPSSVADERRKLLEWKRKQYDWGVLQGLAER